MQLEGSLGCELGLAVEGEDGRFVVPACGLGVEGLGLLCLLWRVLLLLLGLRCKLLLWWSLLLHLRWLLLRRLLLLLKEGIVGAVARIALRVLLRHVDLLLLWLRGDEVLLLSIHRCRGLHDRLLERILLRL